MSSSDAACAASASNSDVAAEVARVFRAESGRILATLIGALRDFDLAQDCLAAACEKALTRWGETGVPQNPGAWLTTTAKNAAIDRVRRAKRFADREDALAQLAHLAADEQAEAEEERLGALAPSKGGVSSAATGDDRLRLIFTCCHPALPEPARLALTLQTLGGLTTEEVAAAFLTKPATMAQRLVRAKRKIKAASIPYRVPPPHLWSERVESVLHVVYLIFNEGYSASSGSDGIRAELCAEAIRLGRLLAEAYEDAEVLGLLALMLLHDSRRRARVGADGIPVLLDEQDRTQWDRAQVDEGQELLDRAFQQAEAGPYALQAAISSLHAAAPTPDETDWPQILGLYRVLHRVEPSDVVALNLAVALSMTDEPEGGPAAGLAALAPLGSALTDYAPWFAAQADMLCRLGRTEEADVAFERAIELSDNEAQRAVLARRRAARLESGAA